MIDFEISRELKSQLARSKLHIM